MTSSSQKAQGSDQIGIVEKYALPYYMSAVLFVGVAMILVKTNEPDYALAYIFIIPYLGKFGSKDASAVSNSKIYNRNIFHVFPLVANVFMSWIMVTYIWLQYPVKNYTTEKTIKLGIMLAYLIAPSIDASHQLIHRPEFIFRAIGFVNMALFQFTVYPVEHLYLHHKYVGTAKDPITSPKNQNFYLYAIKAFFSAHKFTFNYSKRLFVMCMALNWTYLGVLYIHALHEYGNYVPALTKVSFMLAVGLTGFLFLEIIEYIEHYGLIFRKDIDKKQVNQLSSWNADINQVYNWIIFRFQRHSDHHMNAYKIFTSLELTEKMPKFPFGFGDGFNIALIPPLWYFIMNPFVDQQILKTKVSSSHLFKTKVITEALSLAVILHLSYNALRIMI